ncbi:hypothetical protein H7F10_04405 [Acidithiobacillus sp. HP-6]|uniref:hypothetical protein n=1 Tax=unclassified Acidithiobacillus TaxID=2614800 RepID=UPI00187A2641|nr:MULTISPECIES: hypothetical protein [unclassified Acidithiobacillus]MBE7562212.1 hypothetical protein [Acidithiobacillus sp. HP-6]MBE7568937.1 hypothetical protein [Acidithiobacillus sp. HP-2]
MFGRNKKAPVENVENPAEPQAEANPSEENASEANEKSTVPERTPISGIAGGSSKVKASKKKLIWGGLAVFVVAIMIANKVMVPKHPDDGVKASAQTTSAQNAALPTMHISMHPAQPPKAPQNAALPAAPANGALMAMKPLPTATAQEPATNAVPIQAIQNILGAASNGTATVVQVWQGPGNLMGVIYKDADQEEGVAWVNVQNKLVLIGTLVGANGINYNTTATFGMAAHQPITGHVTAPASSVSATTDTSKNTLMQLKNGGQGILVGSTGPVITAYIDPNSQTSHRLYDALETAVDTGKVRARYVLVALKNQGSIKKAEEILSAPSPEKVLSQDERLGKKRANGSWSGGIPGIRGSLYMAQEINSNTALLAAAGYIGDPVVIWCDKAGKAQVATNDGAVGDMDAILSAAGNCR